MVWFPMYTKGRPFESKGGGVAGKFYRERLFPAQMSSDRTFIFRYFDAKILIFIRHKNLKGGGGVKTEWIIQSRVGGGLGMFL